METKAVIFDMDGLLIDSEPLWQEAGAASLSRFGISLTYEQYHSSTGLRTPEWIDHWFRHFGINSSHSAEAIREIESGAIAKIREKGNGMEGVDYILAFFRNRGYRIGLASSSPMRLIDVVIEKLAIGPSIDVVCSAENLPYGKPHPQVFLDCADKMQMAPASCVVFEDSFNGMIAAKAARMKCVVVPPAGLLQEIQWNIADLKLATLADFREEHLHLLK